MKKILLFLLLLSSFYSNADSLKDFSLPIYNTEGRFNLKQAASKNKKIYWGIHGGVEWT